MKIFILTLSKREARLAMVSKLEKIIYNLYICYAPVVIIASAIAIRIFSLSPTKCLFDPLTKDCLFYTLDFNIIYHPLNIINLIFIIYNILYIYYNVIIKQDVVGKTVKKIYGDTKKSFYLRKRHKQISVLLFCYITALTLSYVRFPIILARAIY